MELADWIIPYKRMGKYRSKASRKSDEPDHHALVAAGSAADALAILAGSLGDSEATRYHFWPPVKRPKQLCEGRVIEKQMDVE